MGKNSTSEHFFLKSYCMMAADFVTAVAAYAFLIVNIDSVFLNRKGFSRADSHTFPAELADLWIEDRSFYSKVLDEAEHPVRHIVTEHGSIVKMMDEAVVWYQEVFCFFERIVDLFPGF